MNQPPQGGHLALPDASDVVAFFNGQLTSTDINDEPFETGFPAPILNPDISDNELTFLMILSALRQGKRNEIPVATNLVDDAIRWYTDGALSDADDIDGTYERIATELHIDSSELKRICGLEG